MEGRYEIEELRREIESLPVDGGGKRRGLSDGMRRRVLEAWAKSGLSVGIFSEQVGVSESALHQWRRIRFAGAAQAGPRAKVGRKAGFRPVELDTEETEPRESSTSPGAVMRIEGPRGLRIENARVEDIARLWRALSC